MRILVLGGTSFIGRAISQTLIDRGHTVAICHRGRTEPPELRQAQHIHTDRTHLGAVRDQLAAFSPNGIVDTYALTRRDAEIAVANLPLDVPAVVLSSQDVYEAFDGFLTSQHVASLPLREDAAIRTRRYLYRDTPPTGVPADYEKIDVEAVWSARGACILRLPMVYGAGDLQCREGFVLRRLVAGRHEIPVGAGNLLWSRMHVDDVAAATAAAAEDATMQGTVMNIAEPTTPSIGQWMLQIASAMNIEIELVDVPEDVLPPDLMLTKGHRQHILADARLAESRLLLHRSNTEARVSQSVTWHLQHQTWAPWTDDDAATDDRALRRALV
ncbi:NAD-dependent epimerase/dehydratase family protein [Microbacterium sp.]|uniref:NAD-dependent epimerase/dehydratase family protein n=1 Tax=Microbacterium sp. TaxID=51671 RepID=UPI0027324FB6|nr:NAD-dependent epimerase/dehydratase family protein [Microbacterium sp.]MDP3950469.1 NAD-dependent epimerase/dehydratase family protein [Microbacterium sp.]